MGGGDAMSLPSPAELTALAQAGGWHFAALVLAVSSCLVLVPWLVRNTVIMHTTSLSTNGGVTLWLGANPRADGGWISYGKHAWAISSAAFAAFSRSCSATIRSVMSFETPNVPTIFPWWSR